VITIGIGRNDDGHGASLPAILGLSSLGLHDKITAIDARAALEQTVNQIEF
jgi:hypothetical protein